MEVATPEIKLHRPTSRTQIPKENLEIMRLDKVKFCRVQQSQHVNSTQQGAASASWSLSTVVAKALKTLEESDLQNIQDFEPVQSTSTLHIMTKQRHNPSQALMMTLERRTEEISGELNS
jgi:hypothetical protein